MDTSIKRKLAGASVLAIAALILFPMLSPQTRNARYLNESVPTLGVTPEIKIQTPKALTINVSELLDKPEYKADNVVIPSVTVDAQKASKQVLERPHKASSGQAITWIIQVGSFASAKNALRLRDVLRKQGYHAFEKASEDGKLRRVFVGPSTQREQLAKQAKTIAAKHKLKVQIVPMQPR